MTSCGPSRSRRHVLSWPIAMLRPVAISASLIDQLGSSTFRLTTTAMSMAPAGSRFSSESALTPLYGAHVMQRAIFVKVLA